MTEAAGPPQVLVVEDNQDAADLLRTQIDVYGRGVEVVSSANDVLDRLHDGDLRGLELVMLDLTFDGETLDGYDIAMLLRMSLGKKVRLVGVTGRPMTPPGRRVLGAREFAGDARGKLFFGVCDEVWSKPVPMSRVGQLVEATRPPGAEGGGVGD